MLGIKVGCWTMWSMPLVVVVFEQMSVSVGLSLSSNSASSSEGSGEGPGGIAGSLDLAALTLSSNFCILPSNPRTWYSDAERVRWPCLSTLVLLSRGADTRGSCMVDLSVVKKARSAFPDRLGILRNVLASRFEPRLESRLGGGMCMSEVSLVAVV